MLDDGASVRFPDDDAWFSRLSFHPWFELYGYALSPVHSGTVCDSPLPVARDTRFVDYTMAYAA